MTISPKRLFLIDGLGALLTASLLLFLLARFEPLFGMPRQILHILSSVAAVFAVYSLACHLLVRRNPKAFLRLIAVANAAYCAATAVLVYRHSSRLTALGLAYFIGEIIVIGILVHLEWRAANGRNAGNG